jgi:hypothetical protein
MGPCGGIIVNLKVFIGTNGSAEPLECEKSPKTRLLTALKLLKEFVHDGRLSNVQLMDALALLACRLGVVVDAPSSKELFALVLKRSLVMTIVELNHLVGQSALISGRSLVLRSKGWICQKNLHCPKDSTPTHYPTILPSPSAVARGWRRRGGGRR